MIDAPIVKSDLVTLSWLLRSNPATFLIPQETNSGILASLTFEGWRAREELLKNAVNSRDAFMAMKFGDEQLKEVLEECFKPAVDRAGFTLKTVLEDQPMGEIGDQMRVRIRTSRFVVSDLAHGSPGAYWELHSPRGSESLSYIHAASTSGRRTRFTLTPAIW